MKKLRTVIALFALISATALAGSGPGSFTIGDKTFLLNGQPTTVKAAEIHYPRCAHQRMGTPHPQVLGVARNDAEVF